MIICKKNDENVTVFDHFRCDYCGEILDDYIEHHECYNMVDFLSIPIIDSGIDLLMPGTWSDEDELIQLFDAEQMDYRSILLKPYIFCELWCENASCQQRIAERVLQEVQSSFFDIFRESRARSMLKLLRSEIVEIWQFLPPRIDLSE